MGDVTTAKESTAPSNPDVNPTISKLLKGLQGTYDTGVGVYGKSLYPGVGETTRANWDATLNSYRDVAAGNRYGMDDPGFATLRNKVANDTTTRIYSDFNNSGLFGSDSNMREAGEGLGNALAGLDYSNFLNDQQRQDNAVGIVGAVGSAQDADALAARQAENDLFRRTADAPWERLARSSSILGGTAPYGGTDTSKSVPWWSAALGGVGTVAGAFF